MKRREKTAVFENMPIRRAVLSQIVPAIISQMVALIYNLADTYFVGLLDRPAETAAITVACCPFLMLTAISNLFGVGGASAVSRALGRKAPADASRIAAVSFWLGILAAVVYALVIAVFMQPIIAFCGATDDTGYLVAGYLRWTIWFGGIGTVLNLLLANLVRAEGCAGRAAIGLSLGGMINVVLDPFFVLPRFLGLGTEGAGIATAIANTAAAVYFLICIYRDRESVLRFSFRRMRAGIRFLPEILKVGFPSALQMGLTVVSVSALLIFASRYNTEAVAAVGIAKKLDQLPLFFVIGTATGVMPLLAYNYASGNELRRRKAFEFAVMIAVVFTLLCLVVYEFAAPQLASLFIGDALTIDYSAAFLRRMVVAMPLMAVCYPMILQFQAMARAGEALICSVIRKGLLDIPLLFLFDRISPLYGCMWVQPMVDGVSLVIAVVLYRNFCRRREMRRAVSVKRV